MVPSASAPPSSLPPEAELAIVGAGPVGLYAAYYAGFRGLSTVVLETLPMVGGQVATFYPNTPIFDVPGFPSVTGAELVDRLHRQASAFPIAFRLAEEVTGVTREGDLLRVETRRTDGAALDGHGGTSALRARAVLVAAGIGTFSPQRIPDPAIAAFEDRGLTYLPPPPDAVRGENVLVLGGTERAIDFPVAGRVDVQAERVEEPQDGAAGIRLHGVARAEAERVGEGQRGAGLRFQRATIVDVAGRAELLAHRRRLGGRQEHGGRW